jgi:hypothetical protein
MKKKVTIVLEESVWQAFRGECIKQGLGASDLIEGFLAETLKKWEQKGGKQKK